MGQVILCTLQGQMSRRISFLVWVSHHGLVVFLLPLQALNEMQSINMLGVRQICRNCIALQQVSKLFSPSQLWLEWQIKAEELQRTPIRISKRYHIYELIPLMHGMQQLSCGTIIYFVATLMWSNLIFLTKFELLCWETGFGISITKQSWFCGGAFWPCAHLLWMPQSSLWGISSSFPLLHRKGTVFYMLCKS